MVDVGDMLVSVKTCFDDWNGVISVGTLFLVVGGLRCETFETVVIAVPGSCGENASPGDIVVWHESRSGLLVKSVASFSGTIDV